MGGIEAPSFSAIIFILYLVLYVCDASAQTQASLSDDQLRDAIFMGLINKSFPKETAIWYGVEPVPKQIAVCWESDYSKDKRDLVREAVHSTWEVNSKVEFTGWKLCVSDNGGVRIKVEDTSTPPHTYGLGSEIDGIPGAMQLTFSFKHWGAGTVCSSNPETCIRAIAIHEFGHALGYAHELNRTDPPKGTEKWCDLNGLKQKGDEAGTTLTVTPWDPESIMNYCNKIYVPGISLSKLDLVGLHKYYGSPK